MLFHSLHKSKTIDYITINDFKFNIIFTADQYRKLTRYQRPALTFHAFQTYYTV